jgi:hypothetical protein
VPICPSVRIFSCRIFETNLNETGEGTVVYTKHCGANYIFFCIDEIKSLLYMKFKSISYEMRNRTDNLYSLPTTHILSSNSYTFN